MPLSSDVLLEALHGVALRTLAHLDREHRRALWIEPRWLDCALDNAPAAVRERFAVYRAIAERDARAMLERARTPLDWPGPRDAEWKRFLLLTAMLGAQAGGQGAEARRLWRLHGGKASPTERYVAEWRN
jgi:hypothetical protein